MDGKLATIEHIEAIVPHNNADNLEIASVLGWMVIVKKGEFAVGDPCVYVQVDTILPDKPEFSFLKDRDYRVRTIKLRGTYSQGICFPMSILPVGTTTDAGTDVTEIIGVKKYEKGTPVDVQDNRNRKGFFARWYAYLKWRIFGAFGMPNDFPTDVVSKTDETRIQNCPHQIRYFAGKMCYVTIKHDGTSVTFIRQKKVRVCSRNRELARDDSVYWKMADAYHLDAIPSGYTVQAEIVGPKIQGNPEDLPDHEIRVFNVYYNRKALSYADMMRFCVKYGLPMATLYFNGTFQWDSIQAIMDEVAKARYKNGTQAEGLVFRLCDPHHGELPSFKAVSQEYCFKHGE